MFVSKAQMEWLRKNKPDVAKEFEEKTKDLDKLPDRVKDPKKKPKKDKPKYHKGRRR